MTVYRIRDWEVHFENSKSRERKKCSFCCIPNKQDGLGYGVLLREPDGEALYGAFVAVILIASKQKVRKGYLTASGLPAECPLTARQLSIKCQFRESTIQRMLDVCSTQLDWIERLESECPPSARRVPAECPPSAIEGKGREGKEGEGSPPPEKHFPEVNTPTWQEFWTYCQSIGMHGEKFARDKFDAAEQQQWRNAPAWQPYARRVKTWWEEKGRPSSSSEKGSPDWMTKDQMTKEEKDAENLRQLNEVRQRAGLEPLEHL